MYVRQNLFDCITTHIIVNILEYKYIYNCMYPRLINMKTINFKDFMKKYNLKDVTMNESQLQKKI